MVACTSIAQHRLYLAKMLHSTIIDIPLGDRCGSKTNMLHTFLAVGIAQCVHLGLLVHQEEAVVLLARRLILWPPTEMHRH